MQKIILADVTAYQTRVALLEDGKLCEYYVERPGRERLAGNIYKGVVRNVLPGMEAAFVDIGLDKNAFLYIGDLALEGGDFDFGENGKAVQPRTIREQLRDGQQLLVQVLKDPSGSKGARITMNIALPSRLAVLMPRMEYVGVSRRIEDDAERVRLKEIAERVRPQHMGLIVRTVAAGVSEQELREEVELLCDWWAQVERDERVCSAPHELYRDMGLAVRIVRDMLDSNVERFVVNQGAACEQIRQEIRGHCPELETVLECRDGQYDLFDRFSVESEIKKTTQRIAWLNNGGYLVIDHTEALTVIDVNTGKFVGDNSLQQTILHANLEAAQEIARQIRLRDIGGIILIDFIDMNADEDKSELLRTLREALKQDHTRTNVLGITQLGLVEMTRKKIRQRVSSITHTTCPYCAGSGRVLAAQSVALDILRQYNRMCEHTRSDRYALKVHADVADYLEKSGISAELKNVEIFISRSAHVESFKLTPE